MKAIIAAVSILVLAGCQMQGVQVIPNLNVAIDADGKVVATGGLSVEPVFNGKYGK